MHRVCFSSPAEVTFTKQMWTSVDHLEQGSQNHGLRAESWDWKIPSLVGALLIVPFSSRIRGKGTLGIA